MDKDSKPVSRRLTTSIVLVAVLGGLGTLVYRDLARVAAETRAADVEKPLLARDGNRVTVPPDSPLRNKLTVETVMEKDIQQKLVLPAVVEADPGHLVKVLPPLAGRIMEVKVQLGERVELGQALSVLDSPDLATAYADYDRAKVIFSLAATTRDRQRGLAKIGGGAIKDQQQAETDYVTAEVEQQRALARLKQIGVEADTTNKSRMVTITAPISGSVIDLAVAPGAYWNDTTAALMTIADLTTIWVTANVPEKDTALIAKGQAVDVVLPAYPGEIFTGQVLFVSDVLDSDTRRTKVRIAFANPGIRFKPNMFADVSFITPSRAMTTVPATALVLKDDADQIFVEVAPWIFEQRRIETSFQKGDNVIVKSGVKAGDRVVTKGGVLLND
ncbi:MAG: rane fusion protein heavy metal efflux system [Gaiellales bacterium]|nr:rane fusion protein heavy metal efflux system [Gaiellales bacterium]